MRGGSWTSWETIASSPHCCALGLWLACSSSGHGVSKAFGVSEGAY